MIRTLAFAVALALAHLLLTPGAAIEQFSAQPQWLAPIPGVPGSGTDIESSVVVDAGSTFGFVDRDGELGFSGQVLYGVSMTDIGFASYSRIPAALVVRDQQGRLVYRIASAGYPKLLGDARLVSFKTDLSGLVWHSPDGTITGQRDFAAPVSCFAAGGVRHAVGLLDGSVHLFTPDGLPTRVILPPPARLHAAYGCAVGPHGGTAAVLGVDPQQLSVISPESGAVSTVPLPTGHRREVPLSYSADGRFLYIPSDPGLLIYSVRPVDLRRRLPLSGPPSGFVTTAGWSAVLVRVAGLPNQLVVFRPDGEQPIRVPVPAQVTHIRAAWDGLILSGERWAGWLRVEFPT